MRRFLQVATLSALLALAPAALAQRGGSGGHGSPGGFHGGYSGYSGFHGGLAAPRSFGQFAGTAPRLSVLAPRVVSTAPQYGMTAGRLPVYRPAYSAGRAAYGANRRVWGRRGDYHTRPRAYGYSDPYAYANSWEVLPWDLGYSDLNGEDVNTSQAAQQSEQPEYQPAPEESGGEDSARAQYAPAEPRAQAPLAPEPQLTLIFKDGHTEQIRNYALTQNALLDLDQADSGRVARIPLASLDLAATEKAAQQAGLDFEPPSS